jgi:hypothetical protein
MYIWLKESHFIFLCFCYVISILLGQKRFGLSIKIFPILPIVFSRYKRSLPIGLKILVTPLYQNTHFPLSILGRRLSSLSVSDDAAMSVVIESDWASCWVSRSSRGVSKGFNLTGFSSSSSSSSSKKSRSFLTTGFCFC